MLREPAPALGESLWVRCDAFDAAEITGQAHEALRDFEHYLAFDPELSCQELIDGLVDAALGGVLDRYDAEAGESVRHCLEDLRDRGVFAILGVGTKSGARGGVRPSTELAEERDWQRELRFDRHLAAPFNHRAQYGGGVDSCVVLPAQEFRCSVHDCRPVIGFVVKPAHDEHGSFERHALANPSGQAAVQDARARMIRGLQLLIPTRRPADCAVRATDQVRDPQDVRFTRAAHRPSGPGSGDGRLLYGVDAAVLNALFQPISERPGGAHPLWRKRRKRFARAARVLAPAVWRVVKFVVTIERRELLSPRRRGA